IIVRGATTAITRRTNGRKAMLGGWHPLVQQIWLYALADAQRHEKVAIHHACLVVNHEHLSVTGEEDNLPRFMHRVHSDVSKAINELLEDEGYDAPGQLFDGRKPHMMRLVDPAAQASHLVYEYLNSCAAGLVARPEDMPGTVIEWGMWKSGGIDVVKPPVYYGDRRPDRLPVELSAVPDLYGQFGGHMDALVHHMRKLSEHGLEAIQRARTRPVLGAAAVKKIHPWSEPKTPR